MDRQFPPEIVQLIVEASLDPYDLFSHSWSELRRRYEILTKYSLLNWTWQGASAPSLHELVVIENEEQAASFLDLLDAKGGIIGGIRDLSIELGVSEQSASARILRAATGAVKVSLVYGTVSVDDLAHLQQLRRLELYKVELVGSPASASLSLPRLDRLELLRVSISPSAAHFLTPPSLPQLRKLELDDNSASVDPLVPQLEAVFFESTNDRSLSAATSLQLLLLPLEPISRLGMLSDLPTLPPFLSIDCEDLVPGALNQRLHSTLTQLFTTTKPGLRVILLLARNWEDEGGDDELDALIEQVKRRGIRVVQENFLGSNFSAAIRAMERILAEEKRAVEKVKESKRR